MFCDQVKRSRSKGGLAGPDGTKSVFGQMCAKMSSFSPDSLLLPHRVWKVKFVGSIFFLTLSNFTILCPFLYNKYKKEEMSVIIFP